MSFGSAPAASSSSASSTACGCGGSSRSPPPSTPVSAVNGDSHKNAEIQADPQVRILLQSAKHAGFLMLDGQATISRDKERIEELWNPVMKTWFTEGKDDPRITVICVTPTDGYYWDNKHGSLVAATKMVIGAAIGKTLDDSIEGEVLP